jgi:hypothetical protein
MNVLGGYLPHAILTVMATYFLLLHSTRVIHLSDFSLEMKHNSQFKLYKWLALRSVQAERLLTANKQ